MTQFKILLLDEVIPQLRNKLEAAGYILESKPNLSYTDVSDIIHEYNGVILRSKITADKALIDKGTNLKCIGRIGAGMEIIDVEYAESKGIACINSPEGNRDAVGEQCVGMLLALQNNLLRADQEVRNKIWLREENRGYELKGKTVGIIGYGNMGKAFAQRLSGFDVQVIAYDKYKKEYSDNFAKAVSLETLQKEADIISLHVPQTEETVYMVDESFIDACQKPFILINTARGKVVKTDALVTAMKSGKVSGAALDVLEYESYNFQDFMKDEMPEAFDYLIQSDRVVLSPHIAGWTFESKIKLSSILADKIIERFGSY